MPRLIRHDDDRPYELPPQTRSVWICACGLSKNRPHCDGSHKLAAREPPATLCVYDKERRTVVETRPD